MGVKFNPLSGNFDLVNAPGTALYGCVVAPSGGDYTTIGAAIAAGETSIFVKNGTYTESTLTIDDDNVTIIGESKNGVEIVVSSSVTFNFDSQNGLLQNLKFVNNSNSDGGGFRLGGGGNQTIRNCIFTATGTDSTLIVIASMNAIIDGCTFNWTNTASSISNGRITSSSGDLIITNCLFFLQSPTNADTFARFGGSVQFTNNYIRFFDVSSAGAVRILDFQANENVFSANKIICDSTGATSIRFLGRSTISDNNINGVTTAIHIWDVNGQATSNITGNSIFQAGVTTPIGIRLEEKQCVVSGNFLFGRFSTLAGTGIWVDGAYDDNVITGNSVVGYGTGIEIDDAGADRTLVATNNYRGNTTGLTDSGTGTVTGNNVA